MKKLTKICVGILLILLVGCTFLSAYPALAWSSVTPIGAINENPSAYVGKTVTVVGQYRGYEPGHGAPPVTRSDWVIQDSTGSIYVTGNTMGLRYPWDIGRWVRVTGIVRVKNGQPYIQVPRQRLRRFWRYW